MLRGRHAGLVYIRTQGVRCKNLSCGCRQWNSSACTFDRGLIECFYMRLSFEIGNRMRKTCATVLLAMGIASTMSQMTQAQDGVGNEPAVVLSEFVFENAPFPSSHASTIVETKEGFLAAWFGGKHERSPDVGIWLARRDRQAWTPPVEVATGEDPKQGVRYPCWNPVLFQPSAGPLLLFYKVGPSPASWWGMLMTSNDQGKTWSPPKRLPPGVLGPIRSKPIEIAGGVILCGSSTETGGWQVHMERGLNFAKAWNRLPDVNGAMEFGAIQPTLINWGDLGIQALCRSKQGAMVESWSRNGGMTWSRLTKTPMPNPNAGFDTVLLHDSRALMVYNHSETDRSVLNVAVSDNGKDWQAAVVLENQTGEYSYPAVVQASDGLVHITYTWRRERIKHVVLDMQKARLRPIRNGNW